MPDRRSIFRLLALAGFLLTVALALWLAELRPLLVIVVMAFALAVAWAVEWLSWRQEVPRAVAAEAEDMKVEESDTAPPAEPRLPVFEPHQVEPEPAREPEPMAPLALPEAVEPEPRPVPVASVPEPEPEVAPPLPEPEPEPVPVASAESAPEPEPTPPPRPQLRPVPPPPPEPEEVPPARSPAPEPVPVPVAAASDVVDLRLRVTAQPRRWNLWDLERRARDESQRDPMRYEEWSYLFVHLRQFATPDGSLPTEFDGLVRESFGELLERAG